jgi:branched-chain amino acid transport system substrate-binding protein
LSPAAIPRLLPIEGVNMKKLPALLKALAICQALTFAASAWAADLAVIQIAPLSGVNGGVGWHMELGAQVAFDEVNAAGGINGRKIRLVTVDEAPLRVVEQARELAQRENAVALFGMVGASSFANVVQSQLPSALQLPMVAVNSSAPAVHRIDDPYVFVTRPGVVDELDTVFRHLATVRTPKVALLVVDDAEGEDVVSAAQDRARAAGIELVSVTRHLANSAQVDEAAAKILSVPHHAVVIASNTAAVAYFCKLYRRSGGTGQIVALSSAEATQLAAVVGKEAARGVLISQVVPNPRDKRSLLMREFATAYAKFGQADVMPTLIMTEGYIGARVLIEGLQRSGASPTGATLARALDAQRSVSIAGYRVNMKRSNTPRLTTLSVLDGEGTCAGNTSPRQLPHSTSGPVSGVPSPCMPVPTSDRRLSCATTYCTPCRSTRGAASTRAAASSIFSRTTARSMTATRATWSAVRASCSPMRWPLAGSVGNSGSTPHATAFASCVTSTATPPAAATSGS